MNNLNLKNTTEDFIEVFKYLIDMRNGERTTDDIDHLGNRRIRTVGEQLANQFNIALSRMQRNIRDRMNQREAESLTPQDLVSSRIITTVLNTFLVVNIFNGILFAYSRTTS